MAISKYVLAGLIMAIAVPASAQTVSEDVKCVLLSNMFAKSGTDAQKRQVASQAMAFYLGRLDGRANTQALATAMRALVPTIDPKTVGPAMEACVARFASANQSVQAAGRAVAPPPK